MASVAIVTPASPFVDLAMSDLNIMVSLLEVIQPITNRRWARQNLDWLRELRNRALQKVETHTLLTTREQANEASPSSPTEDAANHLMLVGWRTRLIELGEQRTNAAGVEHLTGLIQVIDPVESGRFAEPFGVDASNSFLQDMELASLGGGVDPFASLLDATPTGDQASWDFLQQLMTGMGREDESLRP